MKFWRLWSTKSLVSARIQVHHRVQPAGWSVVSCKRHWGFNFTESCTDLQLMVIVIQIFWSPSANRAQPLKSTWRGWLGLLELKRWEDFLRTTCLRILYMTCLLQRSFSLLLLSTKKLKKNIEVVYGKNGSGWIALKANRQQWYPSAHF